MSDIEIPDEAVLLQAKRAHEGEQTFHPASSRPWDELPESDIANRLLHARRYLEGAVEATLPFVRRQVLESVVDRVAKIGVEEDGWKILNEKERESRRCGARRVLGISEGDGDA